MKNRFYSILLICFIFASCQEKPSESTSPLRPLIYTEQQNDDPRLAQIREERFLRKLSGSKDENNKIPPKRPINADALGQEIVNRLNARNKTLWEHLWFDTFIFSEEFGSNLKDAAKGRDLVIAESSNIWNEFDPGEPTQSRKKGLASLLSFQSLILGKAQTGVSGTHYSDNILVLEIKEAQLEIQFKIGTILEKDNHFGLLSSISGNETLRFIRSIGLHLRPQLQDPGDYIVPLKVGNYWRYRLADEASNVMASDIFEEGLSTQKGATTKTVEVVSVDRIEGRRLVRFRVSYDDEEKTKITENWLTTPTKIFNCDELCTKNFSDLNALLKHLQNLKPLFSSKETLNVDIELPMGQFDGVLKFHNPEPEANSDSRLVYPQYIYLKPRLGIVRRTIDRPVKPHELLIAYRLLP